MSAVAQPFGCRRNTRLEKPGHPDISESPIPWMSIAMPYPLAAFADHCPQDRVLRSTKSPPVLLSVRHDDPETAPRVFPMGQQRRGDGFGDEASPDRSKREPEERGQKKVSGTFVCGPTPCN